MNGKLAIIVAGGTGGHIFPGLSVADALKAQGWQVKWAGNPHAMEGHLVPKHGIELLPLVFAGFRGKGLLQQLLIPLLLLRAFWVSLRLLMANKPAVVLGMGGYVAFPLGMIASFLNIPLIVHEQNSIAGLTNKVLSKLADRNLVAFPDALPKSTWVGNPVRLDMTQQNNPEQRYSERTGVLKVLVVGGSLGAQALNLTVPHALSLIPSSQRPEVTHQSGQRHLQDLTMNYAQANVSANPVAFIDDMANAMAEADLLICRAGAMTVAEVAALGVAALFIPFPHAVDDHQNFNAKFLADSGAAWMKPQSELTAEWLANWLKNLTRDDCLSVAKKAYALAKPDAAAQVVKYIEDVCNKQHKDQGQRA